MLLKKQTIWLMTMLSLIAVLSVYYLTSPNAKLTSILDQNLTENNDTNTEAVANTDEAADPVFAELRLQLNDNRSKMKEELQTVIATTNISEEERSKAYTKMQQLSSVSSQEDLLETLIKSKGYSDALVRIEDNNVRVTVKAKKGTPEAANGIIQMVTKEIGHFEPVAVEFQK